MRKAIVTGRNGFIGSELSKQLELFGYSVSSYPVPDADLFFFFGSPSSNIIFNDAPDYCIDETITGFLNALRYAKEHKIKLVYPSSATVYQNTTNYSHTKKALEEIHLAYGYKDVLACRIFAGYGPGEGHKGRYASIIYQFCKGMKQGKRPIIYGNGKQSRDFIYIDDVVRLILGNLDERGFIDVGTGEQTSFNRIVAMINRELGTKIVPKYVSTPKGYIKETACKDKLNGYMTVQEGIREIILRLT